MPRITIEQGIAINKLRKLKKQWDRWFPLRQHDPLRGKTAEQTLAEHECARLAPLILETQRIIDRIN